MNLAYSSRLYPMHDIMHGLRNAIAHKLHVIGESVIAVSRMRREYDELSSLTDSELQDMGICRTDIPAVVSGSCRRPNGSDELR
jgi:uncharacterized protein YjiS (DUF1127 family)